MKNEKNIQKLPTYFTLIEMLVVIAIIGILAAMLMPSLRSAMDSARLLSCSNNIKQVGMSAIQYSGDYSSSLPAYKPTNSAGQKKKEFWGFANWALELVLAPYMGAETPPEWNSSGTGLFICPSSGTQMWADTKYHYPGVANPKGENNYSGLLFHYEKGVYGGNKRLLNISSFKSPERSPFQFCSRYGAPDETMINGWKSNMVTAPSWHGDSIAPPRPTVFIDGHAKVLTDILYTMGENDLPNWRSSWKLITYNPQANTSLNPSQADVLLEEY